MKNKSNKFNWNNHMISSWSFACSHMFTIKKNRFLNLYTVIFAVSRLPNEFLTWSDLHSALQFTFVIKSNGTIETAGLLHREEYQFNGWHQPIKWHIAEIAFANACEICAQRCSLSPAQLHTMSNLKVQRYNKNDMSVGMWQCVAWHNDTLAS